MIKSLNNNFFIDLKNSFMIGNTKIDKQCAEKSNLKYIYKLTLKIYRSYSL